MDQDRQRFYRAVQEMEAEGEVEPLEPALEDRLVRGVLKEVAAQRARKRTWSMAAGALALAACMTLFVALQSQDGTIPDYVVLVPGDEQHLGASEPTPQTPRLAEDSVLTVELRPQARVRGQVAVHAFLQQDGSLHPWLVHLAHSSHGVLRLQAPLRELPGLHPGHVELVFAIGSSSERNAPTVAQVTEALRHNPPSRQGGWQVVHKPLDIQPRLR